MKRQIMNEKEWIFLVRKTRRYGSCYIPVDSREWLTAQGVRYTWRPFGRSAQGGGHKHKAYALDMLGAPIPSKDLRKV